MYYLSFFSRPPLPPSPFIKTQLFYLCFVPSSLAPPTLSNLDYLSLFFEFIEFNLQFAISFVVLLYVSYAIALFSCSFLCSFALACNLSFPLSSSFFFAVLFCSILFYSTQLITPRFALFMNFVVNNCQSSPYPSSPPHLPFTFQTTDHRFLSRCLCRFVSLSLSLLSIYPFLLIHLLVSVVLRKKNLIIVKSALKRGKF